MRIAVCDDDKNEISKLQWALLDIQGDYSVDTYQSGAKLIEAVNRGEKYDLLFCDIYMNGEIGTDVAKKIQEISPQTAIVFTTTSTEHAVQAFSIRALAERVRSALGAKNNIVVKGVPTGAPPSVYVPDISRAKGELGLEVRTGLDDAIRLSAR